MSKKNQKKGPRIVHDPKIGFVIVKGDNGKRKILGINKVGWFKDPGNDRPKQSERIKTYRSRLEAKPDLKIILTCYRNG